MPSECIGEEDHHPVAHVYELDPPTGQYVPVGIFRGTLERTAPFPVRLDLDALV